LFRSKKEKMLVIETVRKAALGKLPLVLGVGGNNTQEVKEDLQSLDLSGFDAVLSVSPYYNKPTQEGIYQHYKTLAEISPKPILLYNVPGRTSSNILPETIARLANDFNTIIGVKEAAGSMEQVLELLRIVPENFLIISGDDMLALPSIVAGGDGVISVIGQGITSFFSKMVHLGLKGETREAFDIHFKMMPLIDSIFEEGNPSGIKYILERKNISKNILRLPLVNISEELADKIENQLNKIDNQ